jgi:cyclic pyranopterin monophosphate synthase
MSRLSHLDEQGAARMVDVSHKPLTAREATAEAVVVLSADAFAEVMGGTAPKGDVLATARIAGIQAAKRTAELIPLCHAIPLSSVRIDFEAIEDRDALRIKATAKTTAQTGVEMEALVAAGIAAFTVYDMVKAIDKAAVIEAVRLLVKSGGKSGEYRSTAAPVPKSKHARPAAKSAVMPLMHEATAPRPKIDNTAEREAFRTFMTNRHLRVTEWAKQADIPASHIYAYLTGRLRQLPREVAERLAKAARVSVEDLFAAKSG